MKSANWLLNSAILQSHGDAWSGHKRRLAGEGPALRAVVRASARRPATITRAPGVTNASASAELMSLAAPELPLPTSAQVRELSILLCACLCEST